MSQDEVLRMVASARDQASGPLRKVQDALSGLGKSSQAETARFRDAFKSVNEQLQKTGDVAKTAVAPAIDAIGVSSLSAVGAVAALVSGLKSFVDQGTDVAAFGRKVQLTTNTIRGLEGVADKFHIDPGALREGEQTFVDHMYEIRRHRGTLFASLLARRRDFAQELAATPETTAGNEAALKAYLRVLEDVKRVHGTPTARAFSKEMTGTDAFVDLLRKGNAGLEEAVRLTLKLRGNMDTDAGERWNENWSNFKATIEGIRNTVGNDLLPDLTALARQGQEFFAEHKAEIGRNIAESVREIGAALRGVNTGVQAIGGWKVVFEGLAALKLVETAANILKIASALRIATAAFMATPARLLATLGFALYETVKPTAAGTSDADERAAIERERLNPQLPENRAGARNGGVGTAAAILQGLRDRGLDAPHAAILAGNIEQESGFDPTRPNVAEGGIGLLQWNKERRAALRAFAAKRHALETDLGTQLDFIMKELHETPQGNAFLVDQDTGGMNRDLHRHIRYGDASETRRLANGLRLMPLAERTQPGSLLASAGKAGLGGGGATTVTGSASLDVNVRAPPGTTVRANADGLFDRVNVDRGLSLGRPLADQQ